MTEAVEITSFRLATGLTLADFIAANADINAWLKSRPGFRSRRICQREAVYIVDMLIWATAPDGHRAAAGIVPEMGRSPVHATIDQSTVDWSISEVEVFLDKAGKVQWRNGIGEAEAGLVKQQANRACGWRTAARPSR